MEFNLVEESRMLADIREWRHLQVHDTAKQFGLVRFVDTSGVIQRSGFSMYPGLRDNKKLLEMSFPGSMSPHQRRESMQMLDAFSYAEKLKFLTMEDVVEIQRRVVGGAKGGGLSPFVDERAEAALRVYLDQLNANIVALSHLPLDAEAKFNVAGLFLAQFQGLYPFVDGNGRVAEVLLIATILREVIPFPFTLVRRGEETDTLHDRLLLEESTPSELSAYLVEKAWKAWRFVAAGCFRPANKLDISQQLAGCQVDDLTEDVGSNY